MSGFPLALAAALALAQGAPLAPVPVERQLTPGGRVEQELAAGASHSYEIALQTGQFLPLAVVQDGVDLVLTLTGPSGQPVEIDVPDGRFGREPASALAAPGGTYRIVVRARDTAKGGRYVVEAETLRTATEADRSRVSAERSLAQAAALLREGTPAALKAALAVLDEALRRWDDLQDPYWQAEARTLRAGVSSWASDYASAQKDAELAAASWHQLGERRSEALALTIIAISHQSRYEFDRAIERFREAQALRREAGDRPEQADILSRMGKCYRDRGESAKHVETARESLVLLRETGDREAEASGLTQLGGALASAGDLEATIEHFREARTIHGELGNRSQEAAVLQNMGAIYEELGDSASALAALEQALPTLLAADQRRPGAATENYIAGVSLAAAYHNMGRSCSSLGRSKEALDFFGKALTMRRELGDRRKAAFTLTEIGHQRNVLRDFEGAAAALEEALKITGETRDPWAEAGARVYLGQARAEMGRLDEARDHLRRAAEVARSLGDSLREAQALHLLGRLASEGGDLAAARSNSEAALEVLESMRRRLDSPRLRSTLASSVREAYELYVDVLMALHRQQPGNGFDARALEASERARARSLLDLLAQAGMEVREGSDPALLAKERALQERFGAALDRQMRLSKRPQDAAEAQAAARQVQLLSAELEELKADLRATSPRFMALREPPAPSTASIQKDVLDADTVLLEYALGEKRSFLWVVSRDGLATHELPARTAVNEAAREAYAELAGPEPGRSSRAGPKPGSGALVRLSRMVLGPAADTLRARRLLVVADGALHYVPFSALPHPRGNGDPIVATHEVVSAPSASVLPLLRRDGERPRPPARTLAVVADPVFDRNDERFPGRKARVATAGPSRPSSRDDDLARALRSTGLEGGLPRLPFTRREASAILSLVAARDRKEALDFEASRATVTDPALGDFRIVHFATHGFLNNAQPELSGIVLSLFDREAREARGFLTTNDIFNLRLNAELVVLSGCQTALGEEMRGEGLVGLSRGFMYAGTPRVLASLWRVDDAATAELMKRMYRGILKDRLPPAAALRAAQLDLRRRDRFRHPFYWAAFQLQGEWR